MEPKPLSREQLDAYRAAMPADSAYPAWRLLATLDAAHEDEARALDVLLTIHRASTDVLAQAYAARFLRRARVLNPLLTEVDGAEPTP